MKSRSSKSKRTRPSFLRALGKADPPESIEINDRCYSHVRTYKHDSWAATALYQCDQEMVVCKFNRRASFWGIPTGWIGRRLARREYRFLKDLADQAGVPNGYNQIFAKGVWQKNACAHDFVPGKPLSLFRQIEPRFFEELAELLSVMHRRRMAYVDLHKAENVLVGNDGKPYLIDFQISFRAPNVRGLNWMWDWLLKTLQASDRYHMLKHRTWRLDHANNDQVMRANRPWWIRLHRTIGVPFRTARRYALVLLGIRKGRGMAKTEKSVEPGLQAE